METQLNQILQEIKTLLIEKNKSYQNSYFITRNTFGNTVFLIRLHDKYQRLLSLHNQNKSSLFETYEDTIKDIIGYCLLELLYIQNPNLTNTKT